MLSWVPVGAKGPFVAGGEEGVDHLPEKTLASCPNFYETVEEEQGSYDKLT